MATYYISPSGNDTTGNGSSGNPWLTLAKAYASSTTSDTIQCAAGTYTFATALMSTARTLQAATGATVIFDAGGTEKLWGLGGTWAISGITFQNITQSNAAIYPAIGYLNTSGSGTCTFTSCVFKSITVRSDAAAYGGMVGVLASTGTFTFNNCLIYDIFPVAGSAYGGICKGTTLNVSFRNTVLAFLTLTDSFVIVPSYGAQTLNFINSIVYNGSGKTVTKDLAGTTATYSDFYNITSAPTGTGVITSDPKFIDPTNGDFHLAHDSPALGMGTNL